jgi:hypothetical protein
MPDAVALQKRHSGLDGAANRVYKNEFIYRVRPARIANIQLIILRHFRLANGLFLDQSYEHSSAW